MPDLSAYTVARQMVRAAIEAGLGTVASASGPEGEPVTLTVSYDLDAATDGAINAIISASRDHAVSMSPAHAAALDEILTSMGATLPPG